MSTLSIQHFTERTPNALPRDVPSSTDTLIALSEIKAADRVLVIGRHVADYLIRLAACCQTATGAHPDTIFMRHEAAEVVWITGAEAATAPVAGVICKMPAPRLVVIELIRREAVEMLQPFLRQLAAKGLVHHTYHPTAERLIVAAARPIWLRQVV